MLYKRKSGYQSKMLYNQKSVYCLFSLITNANAKTNNSNPNQNFPFTFKFDLLPLLLKDIF